MTTPEAIRKYILDGLSCDQLEVTGDGRRQGRRQSGEPDNDQDQADGKPDRKRDRDQW